MSTRSTPRAQTSWIEQCETVWSSVLEYSLSHPGHIRKISYNPIHAFVRKCCSQTNRQRDKQTNTDENITFAVPQRLLCMHAPQGSSLHYDDVIMSAIASLITSLTIVYSTVYPGADQSKHQSSASLAFVWGIHRGPVNSPHKWPVTRKIFHLMTSSRALTSTGAILRRSPQWSDTKRKWMKSVGTYALGRYPTTIKTIPRVRKELIRKSKYLIYGRFRIRKYQSQFENFLIDENKIKLIEIPGW